MADTIECSSYHECFQEKFSKASFKHLCKKITETFKLEDIFLQKVQTEESSKITQNIMR